MPGTMFQEVVSSHARGRSSWYTLPLSFLVHTAIIAVLIVVPLIATDVLPMPRRALEFINADFTPVVPAPPPAVRRDVTPPSIAAQQPGVPLVAPDTIGDPSGVIFQQDTVATQGLENVIGGFGVAQNVIEGPPPAYAEPSAPVRPGGDIKPPARIHYVAPVYPEIARRNGVKGIVIIEAVIGVDGRVDNARVLKSVPLLDVAALEAVRAWTYSPTLLNGRPTAVIMTVTVLFNLN